MTTPLTVPADLASNTVLVHAELDASGTVRPSVAELLAAATRIGTPEAVVVTAPGAATAAVTALGAAGAHRVHVVETDAESGLGSSAVAALAAVTARTSPVAVLLPASAESRAVAGRLSVRAHGPVCTDAVGLHWEAGEVIVRHSVFGGDVESESAGEGGPLIVTVRPGAFTDQLAPVPAPEVLPVEATALPAVSAGAHVRQVSALERATGRPELISASTVVAGGLGVGSKEGFGLVEQLADELGAAVGASRSAVDAGYTGVEQQVGQTGVTVSPDLYIALGISGAIQHRVGMQTASTIVAVDKNEDAEIFEIADFGIVADVHDFVPALIERLRARG